MKIECVKVGYLECNCYLLDIGGKVLIIDPGDDAEKIYRSVGNRKVVGIVITHHHFDHDGVSEMVSNKYLVKIYDYYNLKEGINNINIFKFYVIYTPGHKDDLITLYFYKDLVMFCGDFLFKNSIGRCDLSGGNEADMFNSIDKIKKYNDDIVVYPGHGDVTSLGYEKKNNYYFNLL